MVVAPASDPPLVCSPPACARVCVPEVRVAGERLKLLRGGGWHLGREAATARRAAARPASPTRGFAMSALHDGNRRKRAAASVATAVTLDVLSPVLAQVSVQGTQVISCYDRLKNQLDAAAALGDVIVDLTRCESLDATAIGALIAAHGTAAAH